jgi:hypothetical protein
MKATFIIKDMDEPFYQKIQSLPPLEQFNYLNKHAFADLKHAVKMKIGNGSFRDRVDLNSMLKVPCDIDYKIEPRKGYKLATFEFRKA